MTRYQWPPTKERAEAIAKRLGKLHRETAEENDARIAEQGQEERAKMDAEIRENRDGLRQKDPPRSTSA